MSKRIAFLNEFLSFELGTNTLLINKIRKIFFSVAKIHITKASKLFRCSDEYTTVYAIIYH